MVNLDEELSSTLFNVVLNLSNNVLMVPLLQPKDVHNRTIIIII